MCLSDDDERSIRVVEPRSSCDAFYVFDIADRA